MNFQTVSDLKIGKISCIGFISVPYYTAITFKTSWSFLVGLFRAHIVVKLFGSNGDSNFVPLQRYVSG